MRLGGSKKDGGGAERRDEELGKDLRRDGEPGKEGGMRGGMKN